MRKTFLTAAIIAMIAAPFVSSASAQQRVFETMEAGQRAEPLRVAPVLGWENGKPIIGQWQAYKKNASAGVAWPEGIILDAFEGDELYGNADVCDGTPAQNFMANGSLSGGVDPACDFGAGLTGACGDGETTRWFLGGGEVWASSIGPIGSFADNAPATATAFSFAWSQSYGIDLAPPCGEYNTTLAIIQIFDNSVGSLIDGTSEIDATTLGDGFVDGLILDFGPLAVGAGYYWAGPDLSLDDPELHLGVVDGVTVGLPEDGALQMLYWDTDLLGTPVPGAHSQSMLWDAKDAPTQGSWADGILYLDGFSDAAGGGFDCAAYDGQFLIATNDDFGIFNDQSWPGGCPNFLMPMVGLFGQPPLKVAVNVDAINFTIGSIQSGNIGDLDQSDDVRLQLNTVFGPLRYQLDFTLEATSPTENPASIDFIYEGNVLNLAQTDVQLDIQLFNFDSNSYENAITNEIQGPTDTTLTITPTGDVSRFVQPGTGLMRARLYYENTFANYVFSTKNIYLPFRARVDKACWSITE